LLFYLIAALVIPVEPETYELRRYNQASAGPASPAVYSTPMGAGEPADQAAQTAPMIADQAAAAGPAEAEGFAEGQSEAAGEPASEQSTWESAGSAVNQDPYAAGEQATAQSTYAAAGSATSQASYETGGQAATHAGAAQRPTRDFYIEKPANRAKTIGYILVGAGALILLKAFIPWIDGKIVAGIGFVLAGAYFIAKKS
jgi:hypothetical protein